MPVLTFILVLSVLVVVHEFGHFLMARLAGVKVEKFSIGFGPVLFGRRFGDTEFVFSLLPLGGFVKLSGENPDEAKGHAWEFNSKTLWQKFLVVFAGPFMNALLALVIFWAVFLVGQPTFTTKVGKVLPDMPAAAAGIEAGDVITSIGGAPVGTWEELLREVQKNRETIAVGIQRGEKNLVVAVHPKIQETRGLFGKTCKVSFVGVAPSSEMTAVKSPPVLALLQAFERVGSMTALILYSLGLMITGVAPFKDSVTGPIGIFFMTQQAAQMGFVYLAYFAGSLSVSLFVLNLLPIPVLDGGHLLFIFIERLKGSPLPESVKERMTQVGLFLLLGVMGFVILQDIHRFSILQNILRLFGKG